MTRALVTLLLAFLVAGCTGTAPDDGATGSKGGPVIITDPTDFANASLPGSHVHDYWHNSNRAAVFDADATLTYLTGGACPNSVDPVQPNCVELSPLDDGIVPPGTKELNVTVTWNTAALVPATARLRYEAPVATGSFTNGTFELNQGLSAAVNVTSATTDLPHTTQTRWRFWISIPTGNPGSTYNVNVAIDAIRQEGNLTPAPPHPDPYLNRTTLELRSYQGGFNELLGQRETPSGDHPGYDFAPVDNIVAPYTARIVIDAYLNVTSPTATAPKPVLVWHGADRRDNEDNLQPILSNAGANGFYWQWIVDVEPRMWDSPYAADSSWKLFVDWHGGTGLPASATFTQGEAYVHVTAER